jgi:hypothetical protein
MPARESLTVTVGSGTQPQIRWSPDSGVGWLHVGRRDKNQIVWEIRAVDSTNSLHTPVDYGIQPGGAVEMTAPVSLERDVEYEVSVARFTDTKPLGRVLIQVARVKFTP